MAYTIDDMQRARAKVCADVARMLSEFEHDYNVNISEVGYSSDRVYSELSNDPTIVVGKFEMEVRL